ncbi:putative reverse transcriptase domain-containing protein [Tanacetum coccineum]
MALKKRTTRTSPTTTTTTTTPTTDAQLKKLIAQGVSDVLAERDATRSKNGKDNHDSGTGVRRQTPLARECTYLDFMKCQPLNFKGTEGVFKLTQWFERMETVFRISNCTVENQIKFATCTLLGSALTWWNSHVRTVGYDVAYAMTWTNLKKMMTNKYCPRGEIKKLEIEMWNLKVKESNKIEKYVGGLPDMIHGSVMASKPKTMQDAIEFATKLMDKKISTLAERVAIAYTIGPGERKEYAGTLPLCNKCKFHHNAQCTVKRANCKRVCHLTRDCRSPSATNNKRNLTCYECGNQGHYRSDCLELKNQNHGTQAGVVRLSKRGKLNPRYVGPFKALAKVGAVAYKLELSQDLSRVHHTFHVSNLKKCYADEPLVVPLDRLHIDDKLHFVKEPVEIMDHEVKRLKQSRILIIKVRWNSRRGPEFTWEREDQFRKKYSHVLQKPHRRQVSRLKP